MTRCTVQLIACRNPEPIRDVLGEDATFTEEGHVLVVGTQPFSASGLLAEMRALARRDDVTPYVIVPEGMEQLAHQMNLPYVTYGDGPRAHVRLSGHLVQTPLGTAVLADKPDMETLAGIAAALVLRIELSTATHRLNSRKALTATAA